MYIEVFQQKPQDHQLPVAESLQWYFHFKQTNGRIIAVSESYVTKGNAVRAAKTVVRGIAKTLLGKGFTPRFYERQVDGVIRMSWSQ